MTNDTYLEECVADTRPPCSFRVQLGAGLITIGVLSFIWCLVLIFSILCKAKFTKLPGKQNLCIVGILLNDCLLAGMAIVRGLGIWDEKYCGVNDDGTITDFCMKWPLASQLIIRGTVVAPLVPLALERLVSISNLPWKKKTWMRQGVCLFMMWLQWAPLVGLIIYNFISHHQGLVDTGFVAAEHQCLITHRVVVWIKYGLLERVVLTYIADGMVILLYITCILIIFWKNCKERSPRRKIKWRQEIVTSTLMSVFSVLTTIPGILHYSEVVTFKNEYREETIFLSIPFLSCLLDPFIYFLTSTSYFRKEPKRQPPPKADTKESVVCVSPIDNWNDLQPNITDLFPPGLPPATSIVDPEEEQSIDTQETNEWDNLEPQIADLFKVRIKVIGDDENDDEANEEQYDTSCPKGRTQLEKIQEEQISVEKILVIGDDDDDDDYDKELPKDGEPTEDDSKILKDDGEIPKGS